MIFFQSVVKKVRYERVNIYVPKWELRSEHCLSHEKSFQLKTILSKCVFRVAFPEKKGRFFRGTVFSSKNRTNSRKRSCDGAFESSEYMLSMFQKNKSLRTHPEELLAHENQQICDVGVISVKIYNLQVFS